MPDLDDDSDSMGASAPTGGEPVKPAPAYRKLDQDFRMTGEEELIDKNTTLEQYLKEQGVNEREIFQSKTSDKLAEVYKFMKTEGVVKIRVIIKVRKGVVYNIQMQARKMSETVVDVPDKHQAVLVAGAMGRAMLEGIKTNTFETDCIFAIDDDDKLRMTYKVFEQRSELALDTYATVLDPDLVV